MKKTIVIIFPTTRDVREIGLLKNKNGNDYIFYGKNPREDLGSFDAGAFLSVFLEEFKDKNIDGIIGTHDYPGSIIAAVLAEKLGLNGVRPEINLCCQHKYKSRIAQSRLVPEAVPEFHLVDPSGDPTNPPLNFPFFIRPVKSFFSIFAARIDDKEMYKKYIVDVKKHVKDFSRPFSQLFEICGISGTGSGGLIAEENLRGKQVTLEGYVWKKKFNMIGIVDSIMHPGTISFKRFEYPSSLGPMVKKRMKNIAKKLMLGIGFDNGIFNIEFFYDDRDDSIKIIEINPRMASQFADMMEKVNGTNTYEIQASLALGMEPKDKKRTGRSKYAASFVLRSFKNRKILKLPGRSGIKKVKQLYPEARIEIYGREGAMLSGTLQDFQSYRYGIINLGGDSREELFEKYNTCMEYLKFEFSPRLLSGN